ncbi:chaplin [Streptomyces sp. NPDC048603]|uniref:chaplin n=1 Tax=Streptomyces sp. NPDC048603 TaxID=3365577 RepID=UPI00371F0006
MRQGRRNGLIAAVVVSGAVSVGAGGFAFADAEAGGTAERSPGLLAGNLVQLPVDAPVNLCGNTVSVVGLLNPASGNRCASAGGSSSGSSRPGDASSTNGRSGGAVAEGTAKGSPGVITGNGIQLPVQLPVNVSGNSVNVVGVGNPVFGNESVNVTTPSKPEPVRPPVVPPKTPPKVVVVPPAKPPVAPPAPAPEPEPVRPSGSSLAQTGADGVGYLLPAGGALLLGGALLFRRSRVNALP